MTEITTKGFFVDYDGKKYYNPKTSAVYIHSTDADGNDIDYGGIDLKNWRLLDSKKGVDRSELKAVLKELFSELLDEELPVNEPVSEPEPAPAPAQQLSFNDLAAVQPGASLTRFKGDNWQSGYDGELRTAGILSGLKTLHSVMIRSRHDVDHLVFTTRGIFAINTKVSSSEITVDGDSLTQGDVARDWLDDAYTDANTVSGSLSKMMNNGTLIDVKPVIAVWGNLTVKNPSRVSVVNAAQLRNWIDRQPEQYASELVSYLYEVARNQNNWRLA